jgi:hypothetical protein
MGDRETSSEEGAPPGALLRLFTLIIGGTEIIAFLLLAHLMLQSSDPIGASIGDALTLLTGAPLVLLTLPGVILAWLGRAPRAAFALVALAAIAWAIAWSAA